MNLSSLFPPRVIGILESTLVPAGVAALTAVGTALAGANFGPLTPFIVAGGTALISAAQHWLASLTPQD